jgi:hypothetical protein
MKIAIVSSREIARQGTLDADYYVNRRDGESYPDYKRRRDAARIRRQAARHEASAARLRLQAAEIYPEGELT